MMIWDRGADRWKDDWAVGWAALSGGNELDRLSGLGLSGDGGFPRALPWAILFEPYGLAEGVVFFDNELWHEVGRS